MGLVYFLCYLLPGQLVLALAVALIERRAAAARVRPFRYVLVSALGAWLGLIVSPVVLLALYQEAGRPFPKVPVRVHVLAALFGGLWGALGAGAGVVYLRMRLTRHADYEELATENTDSLEADVPEPGNRDHVRPD